MRIEQNEWDALEPSTWNAPKTSQNQPQQEVTIKLPQGVEIPAGAIPVGIEPLDVNEMIALVSSVTATLAVLNREPSDDPSLADAHRELKSAAGKLVRALQSAGIRTPQFALDAAGL